MQYKTSFEFNKNSLLYLSKCYAEHIYLLVNLRFT